MTTPQPAPALFELRQLGKTFIDGNEQHQVLHQIDLKVQPGEFVAITGASGSGKSTLLSIIGLLDQFQQGEYLLCGTDVRQLDRHQLAVLRNKHIGWIFQNFHLIADMTAAENILLPLSYQKELDRTTAYARMQQVLLQVGLADKADARPSQLSGGQQQRIAIARALVTEPDLILADEPTGNLDSKNQTLIFELLQNLHHQGKTIVMVTHSNQLAASCGRQIQLADGKIQQERQR